MPRVFGPGHVSRKPLRQGRLPPQVIHGEACVNPDADRHQGGHALPLRRRSRRAGRSCCGSGCRTSPDSSAPLADVDATIALRRAEADEFYAAIHPPRRTARRADDPAPGARRTALDQADLPLRRRTSGSTATTPPARRPPRAQAIRNQHWRHLNSMRVMTVPDKWEYPWFAAWDLAFQCVVFALIDARVRQGPALGAAVRAVPAPQRPDPGLRVGVLRPEPAGPRLGRLAGLQHGPHPHRARPTATSSNAASTSC